MIAAGMLVGFQFTCIGWVDEDPIVCRKRHGSSDLHMFGLLLVITWQPVVPLVERPKILISLRYAIVGHRFVTRQIEFLYRSDADGAMTTLRVIFKRSTISSGGSQT
jgi:hypothetical protein